MKRKLSLVLAMMMLAPSVQPVIGAPIDSTEEVVSEERLEHEEDIEEEITEEDLEQDLEEEETDEIDESEEDSEEDQIDEPVEDIEIEEGTIKLIIGSEIAYTPDGEVEMPQAPLIIDGSTYVGLKFVVEELIDGTATWDQETKMTTIIKDEKSIGLKHGDDIALINGVEIKMPGAPVTIDGTMMVPLRFLMDEFSIDLEYNDEEKSIILIGTDEPPIMYDPPVAQFRFWQDTYVSGQNINVTENSYDENGFAIVQRMWMIDNDPERTGESFSEISRRLSPGEHTISLKVKNEKGVWSDWYEQELLIEENQPPVITKFGTTQDTYKPGEKFRFEYEYENESWEEIVDVKWTYRHEDDPLNERVFMRPNSMFYEGNYIVTLQLQDAYGNLSEVEETTITIKGDVVRTELDQKFSYPIPGEIIDNFEKQNYRDFTPESSVVRTTNDEVLVMSDSPEVVTDVGILYREVIDGKGRIMLHHLNGFTAEENAESNKHVVITATNETEEPITLKITNKEVKSSVTDPLYIGQRLLEDYFKGGSSSTFTIAPGESVYIHNEPNQRWTTDEVMSGLMDFETTGPLTINVAAMEEHMTLNSINYLPILSKDIHPRGTFPTTEIAYDVEIGTDEPTKLILGERGSDDIVWGIDGITGEVVSNTGNFGITYKVTVTATEDTGIILNPRGGMLQGAIRWDDGSVHTLPETGPIPAPNRAAVVGVVKAGETRTFEYMLPNGSSAPVLIGFIPRSFW